MINKQRVLILFILVIVNTTTLLGQDTITWKKIFKQFNTGYPNSKNINSWKKFGIKTPNELHAWTQVTGFDCNIQDAIKRWKNRGGFNNPNEALKWIKAGFEYGEVIDWVDMKLDDPFTKAKQWKGLKKKYKLSQYDLEKLLKGNITVSEYKSWQKIFEKFDDYNNKDIIDWKKRNVKTPQDLDKWLKIINLNDSVVVGIEKWTNIGVFNPSSALEWKKANFSLSDVNFWLNNKVKDIEIAKKWQELGLSNYQYEILLKNKISISEYKEWNFSNFKVNDIIKWKKAGFNSPTEPIIWTTAGGITDIDFIKELKKIGISQWEEYIPYEGITSINAILVMKESKIQNKGLMISLTENFGFSKKEELSEVYNILLKAGCKKIENVTFDNADEYNNKGLCYKMGGKLFQRIDANSGLVSGVTSYYREEYNGNTVHLTFQKSWRENTAWNGIVLGQGSYRYTAYDYSERVVPNGKLIY